MNLRKVVSMSDEKINEKSKQNVINLDEVKKSKKKLNKINVLQNYEKEGQYFIEKELDEIDLDLKLWLPNNIVVLNELITQVIVNEKTHNFELRTAKDEKDFESFLIRNNIRVDFKGKNKLDLGIQWRPYVKYLKDMVLPRYEQISKYASYPPLKKELVIGPTISPADNGALDEFINFFCPATDADRDLIKALICTVLWGEGHGRKPLFVIAGPDGIDSTVQIGKSTLIEMIQKIFECSASLHPDDDPGRFINGLLNFASEKLLKLDNVKNKIPSDILERFITSPKIFGHAFHRGYVERENIQTWVITANSPKVTEDLATRSQVIRLQVIDQENFFEQEMVEKWIEDNRERVIADIYHILEKEPVRQKVHSRFPEWEYKILNNIIKDKESFKEKYQKDQNSIKYVNTNDIDLHTFVKEYITKYFVNDFNQNVNLDDHCVFIPSQVMHHYFNLCFKWKLDHSRNSYSKIRKICEKAGFIYHENKKIAGTKYRGYIINSGSEKLLVVITGPFDFANRLVKVGRTYS